MKGILQIKQLVIGISMNYYAGIDCINKENNTVFIKGWFVSNVNKPVTFMPIYNNQKIECKYRRLKRFDIMSAYVDMIDDEQLGFEIEIESDEEINLKNLDLFVNIDSEKILIVKAGTEAKHLSSRRKKYKIKKLFHAIKFKNMKRFVKYFFKHGFKGIKKAIVKNINRSSVEFDKWFEKHKATQKELEAQRNTTFDYQPKFSILVPTYNTPIQFLKDMIESVTNQTYANVELCIADGSNGNDELRNVLNEYAKKDSRVRFTFLEENKGIAENTNGALKIATGDYIGLLDHDDVLAPDALYEVVKALQDNRYDIIYTDEDKVDGQLKNHNDPNFKPDFSLDLFRSHNYITHFFVVKKDIMDKVHGFRSEYDGSQDYDLMFRCIENAESIKHIPKILYHWRMHGGSVAGNPKSKMYAYEAGKKAIEDHLKRVGETATVEHTGMWGMYHTTYNTKNNPLLSIIIANKDHVKDLNKCIKSIIKRSIYKNFEIIIVENNSTEAKTFEYYDKIQKQYSQVKVVKYEGIFNYSAINNLGVKNSSGDYILLLNNDTELISKNGIGDMLGICMRKEVGIVGAKLLFADNTVQHAGIVLGFGGFAGHVFSGIGRNDFGYMVRARINCNYSAVTAACLMTKRTVWDEVNGLDESFVVALNDVDFCLRVREKNYLIVYDAFAEWHHYESKSRGYEDTPEKVERFNGEVKRFQERWKKVLEQGDPYYNANFSVDAEPFTLI